MTTEPPVVVGVGLTEESAYVLKKVTALVGDLERVVAVHVLERNALTYLDDSAAILEDLFDQMREQAIAQLKALCEPIGIRHMEVVDGHAAQALHRIAAERNARVVVVGTHGYQGWRALLGETANAVLHDTRNNVLAVLTRDDPGEPKLSYDKILVAVDLSDETDTIIEEASRIADHCHAQITLMTVVKPLTSMANPIMEAATTSVYDAVLSEAETRCCEQLNRVAESHGISATVLTRGQPAAEIHHQAESMDADLVILGTHGTHGPALLLGSTPNTLLHGITCDVLAVRVGLDA